MASLFAAAACMLAGCVLPGSSAWPGRSGPIPLIVEQTELGYSVFFPLCGGGDYVQAITFDGKGKFVEGLWGSTVPESSMFRIARIGFNFDEPVPTAQLDGYGFESSTRDVLLGSDVEHLVVTTFSGESGVEFNDGSLDLTGPVVAEGFPSAGNGTVVPLTGTKEGHLRRWCEALDNE